MRGQTTCLRVDVFGKFQEAQNVLIDQLRVAQEHHSFHQFQDVDVRRVTTHSIQKSAATLLKSSGRSTAVVAVITGTSARVLDTVYNVPTQRRQRQALPSAACHVAAGIIGIGIVAGHGYSIVMPFKPKRETLSQSPEALSPRPQGLCVRHDSFSKLL